MKSKPMLVVEWQHLDKDGKTCDRCAQTGRGLRRTLGRLRSEWEPKGIRIQFKEKKLNDRQIRESNRILFNGRLIEDLLPRTRASENHCGSCSRLVNRRVTCRTVKHEGQTFCAIPPRLIRKAALAALRSDFDQVRNG